jgi:hypothetical protein
MFINDNRRHENVFLLPKTIDYYQEQLTSMLETERFGEAIQMLTFLLGCRTDDPQTMEEWSTLLDWLHATFGATVDEEPSSEEEELTEQDLHKQRFYAKMSEDPGYVKKLLETVLNHPDLEKKMIAIEQLVVAEHPQIDETLKRWMEKVELHPLIQYKVLQALRARGATGTVEINRSGEVVQLEIEDTPLDPVEDSEAIRQVIELVRRICESDYPSLVYFAEHTWREFLSFVYGTTLYKEMLEMSPDDTKLWAAALHYAVVVSMSGSPPSIDAVIQYGLDETAQSRYEQRCEQLYGFIHHTFTP